MSRHENTRAHYRVVYPVTARPRFRELRAGIDHPVLDCSEKGLRFLNARSYPPAIGSEVEGTVLFPDGEQQRVAGVVVRNFRGEVALHLIMRPIPFTLIIEQQRYLRKKFPLMELMDKS